VEDNKCLGNITNDALDLLTNIFQLETSRISMEDLQKHPFVQSDKTSLTIPVTTEVNAQNNNTYNDIHVTNAHDHNHHNSNNEHIPDNHQNDTTRQTNINVENNADSDNSKSDGARVSDQIPKGETNTEVTDLRNKIVEISNDDT